MFTQFRTFRWLSIVLILASLAILLLPDSHVQAEPNTLISNNSGDTFPSARRISSVPSDFTVHASSTLSPTVLFRDDFNGAIDGNWTIQNNDGSYYNTMADHLELRANAGDIYAGLNNHKNLFLIDTPTTADFDLTIRVIEFSPAHQHAAQLDLVVYDDDDNLVRHIYGYPFGAHNLEFGAEVAGVWSNTGNTDPEALTAIDFGNSPFYLRLKKVGDTYRQYYSTDGVVFTPTIKTVTYGDGTPTKVGFVAMVDPSESSIARIDWFELTQFRVFLPIVLK